MSEPRRADMKAPHVALLFALVLRRARTDPGNFEETEMSTYMTPEEEETAEETLGSTFTVMTMSTYMTPEEADAAEETLGSTFPVVTSETALTVDINSTLTNNEESQLEFILMVLIPLVLLVLLLLSVVFIGGYYRRKRAKQEPSSQGSQNALHTYELGSENMKVPIFEEDTPSVMEIEMEELDKWMNSMNRNANSECLPTLQEEKEPNHPSDTES
ncbi:transmembrane protein 154 isoform X2 [Tenrec ecaudatus]|uniref:transmembrane protein 154 isoform X2 n=1 Tax=Tenrec ecaudatus TaxID=94439 RepID=UPI003F5949D0